MTTGRGHAKVEDDHPSNIDVIRIGLERQASKTVPDGVETGSHNRIVKNTLTVFKNGIAFSTETSLNLLWYS